MPAGLTEAASTTALQAVLPAATNRYVGLFTVIPTARAGTGGTEATGSGYARIAHSSWTDVANSSDVTYRKNNGAVTFAALSDALSGVKGWGIWDASTAGTLLAFGPIKDVSGVAVTKNFISGDQPRFLDGELKIGIGDTSS